MYSLPAWIYNRMKRRQRILFKQDPIKRSFAIHLNLAKNAYDV